MLDKFWQYSSAAPGFGSAMTDAPLLVRGRPVALAVILVIAGAVIVAIAVGWGGSGATLQDLRTGAYEKG